MARPVRIYLDTALLLDRADGEQSSELIERFDAAVIRSAAHVVITVSHFWDIHAHESPEGRERAIATMARLPNPHGVLVCPRQVEEPRIEAAMIGERVEENAPDISLGEVPDWSAVVDENAPGFIALARGGVGMAEAGNVSRRAQPAKGSDAVMAEFIRRYVGGEKLSDILTTLVTNDEAARMVSALFTKLQPIEEEGRNVLKKQLDRVGGDPLTWVRVMLRTKGSPADFAWSSTKNGERRWYEAARRYGPGMYVSRRLSQINASNPDRNIKSSDLADVDHVTHLPYMDFATVDKENHGKVQTVLRELLPPATVRLYRNGDFSDMVDALERLPVGTS